MVKVDHRTINITSAAAEEPCRGSQPCQVLGRALRPPRGRLGDTGGFSSASRVPISRLKAPPLPRQCRHPGIRGHAPPGSNRCAIRVPQEANDARELGYEEGLTAPRTIRLLFLTEAFPAVLQTPGPVKPGPRLVIPHLPEAPREWPLERRDWTPGVAQAEGVTLPLCSQGGSDRTPVPALPATGAPGWPAAPQAQPCSPLRGL